MHIDLRKGKPSKLEAEVAIVGAGPAGQTIARKLADAGVSVIILESGGFDYEAETADLNDGENVGQAYYDLKHARLRMFGGTSAIWGGRSAQLCEIDFEKRPWVEWSGWPFGLRALRPYYDQAWQILQLEPQSHASPPEPIGELDGPLTPFCWSIDRAFDRFGAAANSDLLKRREVTVVTHATVTDIVARTDGNSIDRLEVRGADGSILGVVAKYYVIAAGGIENARLLLASNGIHRQGLGNSRDLVGRFFMEHPHARGGRVRSRRIWELEKAFRKRSLGRFDTAWLVAPSRELQRDKGILNGAATLAMRPPPGGQPALVDKAYRAAKYRFAPDNRGRRLWHHYKRVGRALRGSVGPLMRRARHSTGREELTIVLRAEQSPNPDSRVMLSSELDATGTPRVQLDWRLQRQDKESAAGIVDAMLVELRRHGIGEVQAADWLSADDESWESDETVSAHPLGGYHHMGTTRMADDPACGVTNGWGRVHEVENLYVAGSSLFPTSGWANPTLTILAVSLRTADRLLSLLRPDQARA